MNSISPINTVYANYQIQKNKRQENSNLENNTPSFKAYTKTLNKPQNTKTIFYTFLSALGIGISALTGAYAKISKTDNKTILEGNNIKEKANDALDKLDTLPVRTLKKFFPEKYIELAKSMLNEMGIEVERVYSSYPNYYIFKLDLDKITNTNYFDNEKRSYISSGAYELKDETDIYKNLIKHFSPRYKDEFKHLIDKNSIYIDVTPQKSNDSNRMFFPDELEKKVNIYKALEKKGIKILSYQEEMPGIRQEAKLYYEYKGKRYTETSLLTYDKEHFAKNLLLYRFNYKI